MACFYKDYDFTQDGKWLKRKSCVSVPIDFYRVNDAVPNISEISDICTNSILHSPNVRHVTQIELESLY